MGLPKDMEREASQRLRSSIGQSVKSAEKGAVMTA